MANLQLPNPAQVSDQLAALLQSVGAAVLNAPVATVVPTNGASTDYTYEVVAETNGAVVPAASVSITTGAATLSLTAFNTINWTPLEGVQTPVTYSVYRSAGGTNQGLIASGLTGLSLVDNGISATSGTAPSFNTSALRAGNVQQPVQVLAASGAITIAGGTVLITGTGVVAATLAAPVAGAAGAGGMDGVQITVVCETAHAHTITVATGTLNGADTTVTFTAAALNQIRLTAYNGNWYTSDNLNGTLS